MAYVSSKKTERLFMPYKIVLILHLLSMVSSRCVVFWFLGMAVHAGAQTELNHFREDKSLPRVPVFNSVPTVAPADASNMIGAIYINGHEGVGYWFNGQKWLPLGVDIQRFPSNIPTPAVTNDHFHVFNGFPCIPIKASAANSHSGGSVCMNSSNGHVYWNDTYQISRTFDRVVADDGVTVINTIQSAITGRTWMDRNMGAIHAFPADNTYDADACGSYFQWCRIGDGHEKPNSATWSSGNGSGSAGSWDEYTKPYYGKFIIWGPNGDWLSAALTETSRWWNGSAGTNNPCPNGYHVPTEAEFVAENNGAGIPRRGLSVGYRSTGGIPNYGTGQSAFFWSSTITGNYKSRVWTDYAGMQDAPRGNGFPVRCIHN